MWKCFLPLPYFPSVFVCVPMVLFTTQEKSCINVNSLNLSKLLETFQRTSEPLLLLNLHHTQIGFVILYYIHWHGYFFCYVLFLGVLFFFFYTNAPNFCQTDAFCPSFVPQNFTSGLARVLFCIDMIWAALPAIHHMASNPITPTCPDLWCNQSLPIDNHSAFFLSLL